MNMHEQVWGRWTTTTYRRSHFSRIDRIVHDRHPAFESGHLEERDVGDADVVKGYPRIDPLCVVFGETGHHVRNYLSTDPLTSDGIAALNSRDKPGKSFSSGTNSFDQVPTPDLTFCCLFSLSDLHDKLLLDMLKLRSYHQASFLYKITHA